MKHVTRLLGGSLFLFLFLSLAAQSALATPPAPSGLSYPTHSQSTDAFGNVTDTWTAHYFETISGASRLVATVSEWQTHGIDGSYSVGQPWTIYYGYDGSGFLTTAVAFWYFLPPTAPSWIFHAQYSTMVDAFGNVTETWSTPRFTVIGGQATRSSTLIEHRTWGVDGSMSTVAPYEVPG